jgi:hypothetical protein
VVLLTILVVFRGLFVVLGAGIIIPCTKSSTSKENGLYDLETSSRQTPNIYNGTSKISIALKKG